MCDCSKLRTQTGTYPKFVIGIKHIGPIFLHRFRLYVLSFMFIFMFANICFEKNQNSKIHVTFMINITWNETGICSFGAVWAVRAVGKK